MRFDLQSGNAVLARTPAVLNTLLDQLPEPWITGNEGARTWSPYDVVGHLIHGERTDWIPRARIILDEGESRTFDVFDREAQFTESRGKSLADLLQTFGSLRAQNIETLQSWNLGPEQMAMTGRHPEFGRVTMEQLLATWVLHDLDHIAQIARVMAKQYEAAVGPWTKYFRILGDRAARAQG